MFGKKLNGWGVARFLREFAVGEVPRIMYCTSSKIYIKLGEDKDIDIENHSGIKCEVIGEYSKVKDVVVGTSSLAFIMVRGVLYLSWPEESDFSFNIWSRDGEYPDVGNDGWKLHFGGFGILWRKGVIKVK